MTEMVNPYIAGAPVTEARMFFGREDVFGWIEGSLTGRYADHILVIHGQRRVGKTSVLKQLPNRLPERYIPVFFDLQGRIHTTLDRFLWWLARDIVRALRSSRDVAVPQPAREAFASDPDYLDLQFLPSLRPHLGDDNLLLAFDEFDALEESAARDRLARPVIDCLRRLMGREGLNFIFSIGSSGRKLENMQASYTEFFKAALYKKITFLGQEDTHRLVTQPAKAILRFDRKAVDRIYSLTSGHPYYTQLLCHELFSQCQRTDRRRVREADVDAILDDVVERGTVNLKFVWDEASDLEKWVLASVAHMGGAVDAPALAGFLRQQRVRFSDPDLDLAVLHLREKDVLTADSRFVIDLMRIWLEKNRPMERVREELVEISPIANRYIEIGHEYSDQGLYPKAIESFQQALQVDGENVRAQVSLGAVYLAQEDYEQAVTQFERALALDDEDVAARAGLCDAHLALGDQALAAGNQPEAIHSYRQVLAVNAEHTDARLRLADIYRRSAEDALRKGREGVALDSLEEALRFTPEDQELAKRHAEVKRRWTDTLVADLMVRAEDRLAAGQWEQATALLQEALELDPDRAGLAEKLAAAQDAWRAARLQAILERAKRAEAAERWGEVVEALGAYLEDEPGDPRVQQQLGAAQQRLRDSQLEELREQARRQAEAEEWDQALNSWQAYVALQPEDRTEAQAEIQQLKRMQEMEQTYADAKSAISRKDYDRAVQLLKGLIVEDETYKDASRLLADAIESRRKGRPAVRSAWLVGGVAVVVIAAIAIVLSRSSSPLRVALTAPTGVPSPVSMAGPTDTPTAIDTPVPTRPAVATAPLTATVAETVTPSATRTPAPSQTPTLPREPAAGATRVLEPVGITMVYVPAGEFVMGSSDADEDAEDDEKPQHTVYLDGYWIGQTEVTNAQFAQFIEAGGYAQPEVWGEGVWADWDWVERMGLTAPYYWDDERWNQRGQPVVGVSWHEAMAFAAWAGARLPTEAEWEKAARGTDGRVYPWGDTWDGTRCNTCDARCWGPDPGDDTVDDGYGGPAPVGSYPSGASPYGVLDMAGNVWEWCSTWYDAEYYAHSPGENPQGPDAAGGYRILRGGAYNRSAQHARSTNRNWNWGDTLNSPNAGFRIVLSGEAAETLLTPEQASDLQRAPSEVVCLVYPGGEMVQCSGWPVGAEVTLLIDDPDTGPGTDYRASGYTEVAPWDSEAGIAQFSLDDVYQLLRPGDLITCYGAGVAKEHTVTPLAILAVDTETDIVRGVATPGSQLEVVCGGPYSPLIIELTAGPDGNWEADFGGLLDIHSPTPLVVNEFDDDGDATSVRWHWPE